MQTTEKQWLIDTLRVTYNKQSDFVCPITEAPLASPCELVNCRFYTKLKEFKSCIFDYLHRQAAEELQLTEVAFLDNLPRKKVDTLYKQGILRLQRAALKQRIVDSHVDKVEYLEGTGLCCICRKPVENITEDLQVSKTAIIYCSKACQEVKPKKYVQLEVRYGSNIADILATVLNYYQDMEHIGLLLGLTGNQLMEAYDTILGVFLDQEIAKVSKSKLQLLRNRFVDKIEIVKIRKIVERKVNNVIDISGNPTVSFKDLETRLKELISV